VIVTQPEIYQAGDCGLEAEWRNHQVTNAELLERMVRKGYVAPLLSSPGVSKKIFRRDWLHGCDQGIGADFLGNFCEQLLEFMPGNNKQEKVEHLKARIDAWYERNHVTDRIYQLTYACIKGRRKQPKLKGSAGQIRALIPWAHEAAVELLNPENQKQKTIMDAAAQLNRCYQCLSKDDEDWETVLPVAARQFASCYMALHVYTNGRGFKPKPKLHYFIEMCESGQKLSLSWTCRDEDFGGRSHI